MCDRLKELQEDLRFQRQRTDEYKRLSDSYSRLHSESRSKERQIEYEIAALAEAEGGDCE